MLKSLERASYLEPTPDSGRADPPGPGGRGRDGPGPDRHRQDGRLCHPHPGTAQAAPQGRAAAGPGPGAHPRTGRPGPRRVHQAGRGATPPRRGRLRRQADPQTDRTAQRGGRPGRGHPRPRAGPDEPRHADAGRVAFRGPRRGRPHVGHRLPPRHREDPPPLSAVAADDALQRHHSAAGPPAGRARTCASRKSLDFSSKDLSVETIEQFYFTVDPEQKYDLLVRLLEREQPAAGHHLLPHQAGDGEDPSPPVAQVQVRRHHLRRLAAEDPRPRDAGVPPGQDPLAGGHRRGGPRHRRDRDSRTSSTTTFRSSATTTCIAWAAPAAWAARAWPTPSSRPRRATS